MASRPPSLAVSDRRDLSRRLLRWYRRARRPMPWRETRDPWAIWVSEIMLQQTRVATAMPYYERFMRRFPTATSLARAPLDAVLARWAGLGYYRRARLLHAAARVVAREHGGRVPADPRAFGALPGVGRYTLGAVLSIAFDRPLPVLDGNVARVFARVCARRWSVRTPADARTLWDLAASLVPMRRSGDWNQALMELGATICTPRSPRCGACPIARHCRALALGRPEAFPPAAPRRPATRIRRAVARIERRGRTLVVRRRGPLLGGLWEPPGVEIAAGEDARAPLAAELERLGVRASLEPTGKWVRHTITHRTFEVEVWAGRAAGAPPRRSDVRWVAPAGERVALSALGRRVLGPDASGPAARHAPARARRRS